jgi:hypothetical protein
MRLTSQMPPHMKIGFLGAGKMATALAKGFLQSRILEASGLTASDIDPSARAHFAQETGARMLERNVDVVRASNIVVLAVKPNQVEALLAEIKSAFKPGQLLISIAAGITIAKLEGGLAPKARVIRVMPNTPALVGALGHWILPWQGRHVRRRGIGAEAFRGGRRCLPGEGGPAQRRDGIERKRSRLRLSHD